MIFHHRDRSRKRCVICLKTIPGCSLRGRMSVGPICGPEIGSRRQTAGPAWLNSERRMALKRESPRSRACQPAFKREIADRLCCTSTISSTFSASNHDDQFPPAADLDARQWSWLPPRCRESLASAASCVGSVPRLAPPSAKFWRTSVFVERENASARGSVHASPSACRLSTAGSRRAGSSVDCFLADLPFLGRQPYFLCMDVALYRLYQENL